MPRGLKPWLRAAVVISATIWVVLLPVAPGFAETPQERCQRGTNEYNQTQQAIWQAAHPGQSVPNPAPWPAYQCVDTGSAGGNTGGTNTGGASSANGTGGMGQRPHRGTGGGTAAGGGDTTMGWSENGEQVGDPRTNIGTRDNGNRSGSSALDSARSNVHVPQGNANPTPGSTVGDNPTAATTANTINQGGLPGQTDADDADNLTGISRAGDSNTDEDSSFEDRGNHDSQDAEHQSHDDQSENPATVASTAVPGIPRGANEREDATSRIDTAGDDAGVMLAGGAAAFVGAVLGVWPRVGRRKTRETAPGVAGSLGTGDDPWRGQAYRFGYNQLDGDRQDFVLLTDAASPRQQRFDAHVPAGGHMVQNPDGSVDIVDANGVEVDHLNKPWAYDATGRPVPTYYEVDNDTGEVIQHIDPDRTTVYPVVADPEHDKNAVSVKRARGGSFGSGKAQKSSSKKTAGKRSTSKKSSSSKSSATQSSKKAASGKKGSGGSSKTKNTTSGASSSKQGSRASTSKKQTSKTTKSKQASSTKTPKKTSSGKRFDPDRQQSTTHTGKEKTRSSKKTQQSTPKRSNFGRKRSAKTTASQSNRGTVKKKSLAMSHRRSVQRTATQKRHGSSKQISSAMLHRRAMLNHGRPTKRDQQLAKALKNRSKQQRKKNAAENYIDGFGGAMSDTVNGVRPLVGLGGKHAPSVKDAWKDGPGALVGLSDKVSVGDAWKAVGKDTVAWDEFSQGHIAEGLGKLTFNAATIAASSGVGGAAKATQGASAGSRVGRVASSAGKSVGKATVKDAGKTAAADAGKAVAQDVAKAVATDTAGATARRAGTGIAHGQSRSGGVVADTAGRVASSEASQAVRKVPERSAGTRKLPEVDPQTAPVGDVRVVKGDPAPIRGQGQQFPDAGNWRQYPNPLSVDELARNDMHFRDDARPWGRDPATGRELTKPEYDLHYMQRSPGEKHPLAFDAEDTPLVARWDPANDRGFLGNTDRLPLSDLPAGKVFSRIGGDFGKYFTDPGTSIPELSIPPYSVGQDMHMYRLADNLPKSKGDWIVDIGTVAPDHGQPGGGMQYMLGEQIGDRVSLLNARRLVDRGVLVELSRNEVVEVLTLLYKGLVGE